MVWSLDLIDEEIYFTTIYSWSLYDFGWLDVINIACVVFYGLKITMEYW